MQPVCSQTCKLQCREHINLAMRDNALASLWGPQGNPAPSQTERKARIYSTLSQAYDATTRLFHFAIGGHNVCEKFFISIHGLSSDGAQTTQWKHCKKLITQDMHLDQRDVSRESRKDAAVWSFIQRQLPYCDQLPTPAGRKGVQPMPGDESSMPKFIYPSNDWRYLYHMYEQECTQLGTEPCSEQYFQRLRKRKFPNMHKATAKGNFSKCAICINIQLLKAKRQWTAGDRALIEDYQRRHNERQMGERRVLQQHRDESRLAPSESATILFDAMDTSKGDLPSAPAYQTPKAAQGMQHYQQRIWGVEVINGDIDGTHLFVCDDFVSAGSNLGVEVIRQTLGYLGLQRNQRNQPAFPKRLNIHCDNCSEQKNCTMFAYLSLLVSYGFVEEIRFQFLMPGAMNVHDEQRVI